MKHLGSKAYDRAMYVLGLDLTPRNVGRYDGALLYEAMKNDLLKPGDEGKVAYTKDDPFTISLTGRWLGILPNMAVYVRTQGGLGKSFILNSSTGNHIRQGEFVNI